MASLDIEVAVQLDRFVIAHIYCCFIQYLIAIL